MSLMLVERFYSAVSEGVMLCSVCGNGHTESEAVAEYARKISNTQLVINATDKENRKEITVPNLTGDYPEKGMEPQRGGQDG